MSDLEFQNRLLAMFTVEAGEHAAAIAAGLVSLQRAEPADERAGIIEILIREAHSLKGAARAVGSKEIEGVCQSLESVLAALKRRPSSSSPQLYDVLHRAGDLLYSLAAREGQGDARKLPVAEVVHSLEGLLKDEPAQESETPQVPRREVSLTSGQETVRVATSKLDSVLRQAEELLTTRLAVGRQAAELKELHRQLSSWKKNWTRNPALGTLGRALESIIAETEDIARKAERNQQSLSATVARLQEDMRRVLLQPFATILDVIPKLIRDLSRDQGKEADLLIRGSEIEIDKRILEEMKDPLIHLVRNCIDHGVETSEERGRKGKQPRGRILISSSPIDGSNVEILIEDDGAGIDCARVRAAALRMGILSREQAEKFNAEESMPFIFHSGLSTAAMITDVSGRGLGLAIVQEKVGKLGGRMSVENRPGGGTVFRIVLPLALATLRGVIVQAGGQLYAFPAAGVERVVQVDRDEVRTVENREAVRLGGQALALVRLRDVLETPGPAPAAELTGKLPAVVLHCTGRRIVFLVDQIIDEQEILVKNLGSQLRRVRNLAGATLLGTGKTVPVLNIPDLILSAQRLSASGLKPAAQVEEKPASPKSVLLVEDSITSRMLLKSILENAGYEVSLAVDGIDAITRLRSGSYDLVVSDVQMPRMNGFDLTAKIRLDKKLGETPVVLVTALESREDRERGIEVGANAYIVKSSFDQSNLLEVIGRLL